MHYQNPRRYARSGDLYRRACEVIPGGVNSTARARFSGWDPYPLFVDQGTGSHLRDVDGNDYIDYLLDHRRWLAGPALTLADLAAAAQLSVADYLGGIDWRGHKQTADWYAVMKSRPSFRPLLAERMEVIQPPAHYDKVDF